MAIYHVSSKNRSWTCLLLQMAMTLVLLAATVPSASSMEMYCGNENCYEVLGVDADHTTSEIKRAYRKLAKTYHPDRPNGSAKLFQRIATAYETLSDEESRKNYDYYLAHPEEAYYNQYRYYRHKATPKVDVLPIILVLLTVTSVCQYLYWNGRYNQAIAFALNNNKFRQQAKTLAIQQGLLDDVPKSEHENILKKVVIDNLDLHGSYAPANLWDVAWVQVLISPYTLAMYFWVKHIRWHYRYNICGADVANYPFDRDYLMQRHLGISKGKFDYMDEEEKNKMLEQRLWIKENARAYMAAKEEEAREKFKNSTKYKWEKRWRKANG